MTIRILNLKERPEFLETLCLWHHNQWNGLNPNLSMTRRQVRMRYYLTNEFIPTTWIAIEGETLLGSAAIIANDMDTRMHLSPWMASVFVASEHRGRGIASQLIRHLMKMAKENDETPLFLFTPDAEALYIKLGWKPIETTEYRGKNVTVMKIDLI
jgi:GNAT superfamily N-acetyltransferase